MEVFFHIRPTLQTPFQLQQIQAEQALLPMQKTVRFTRGAHQLLLQTILLSTKENLYLPWSKPASNFLLRYISNPSIML